MRHAGRARVAATVGAIAVVHGAASAHTMNILLTGYWPPTNEMVRQFSTSGEQNPDGWRGKNWKGRGYDVYSFFPEFPNGLGKGEGDLEVDYQDTSQDFWRITAEIRPVAIITFSRGFNDLSWEVESQQRNLDRWIDDYQAPFQPTPAPPDGSVPPGWVRRSTLPMRDIVSAVRGADLGLDAYIDEVGYGGAFLSEFIAYHGTWYQALHADPSGPWWTVAAGHVHVGGQVPVGKAVIATELTVMALMDYLDRVIPAPGTAWVAGAVVLGALVRRRRGAA